MAATFLTILTAVLLAWSPQALGALAGFEQAPILLIVVASVFLLILTGYWVFVTLALQRAEKRLIPRVIDLFRSDYLIRIAMLGISAFIMLSYVLSVPNLLGNWVHPGSVLVAWLIFLGLAIDAVHMVYSRVMLYVDPITSLGLLESYAVRVAKTGDEVETAAWIDSLSTLATKALRSGDSTLAERSVTRMYRVLEALTEGRLKNHITHERLSYLFVYYSQRLELIFSRAAQEGAESLCLHSLNQLGKAAVLGNTIDHSIAALPLLFINKLTERSEELKLSEVPEQSSVMLVEVARSIIENAKESAGGFKEPLLTIIGFLEEIEDKKFAADKEIDFDILKQPFRELFEILKDEEILQHPDTVPVLEDVERVVGNMANLELVLQKMLMENISEPTSPSTEDEDSEQGLSEDAE